FLVQLPAGRLVLPVASVIDVREFVAQNAFDDGAVEATLGAVQPRARIEEHAGQRVVIELRRAAGHDHGAAVVGQQQWFRIGWWKGAVGQSIPLCSVSVCILLAQAFCSCAIGTGKNAQWHLLYPSRATHGPEGATENSHLTENAGGTRSRRFAFTPFLQGLWSESGSVLNLSVSTEPAWGPKGTPKFPLEPRDYGAKTLGVSG